LPRSTRWSSSGLAGLIVALFGLAIAGALCGRHDSEFALFAGGTMTVLLIGMTMGGGSIEKTEPAGRSVTREGGLGGWGGGPAEEPAAQEVALIGADWPRFFLAAI